MDQPGLLNKMGGFRRFLRRVFRRADLTPETFRAEREAWAEFTAAKEQARLQAQQNKARRLY
jgi:hypothetical protein